MKRAIKEVVFCLFKPLRGGFAVVFKPHAINLFLKLGEGFLSLFLNDSNGKFGLESSRELNLSTTTRATNFRLVYNLNLFPFDLPNFKLGVKIASYFDNAHLNTGLASLGFFKLEGELINMTEIVDVLS